jgi:hypothetical protein
MSASEGTERKERMINKTKKVGPRMYLENQRKGMRRENIITTTKLKKKKKKNTNIIINKTPEEMIIILITLTILINIKQFQNQKHCFRMGNTVCL